MQGLGGPICKRMRGRLHLELQKTLIGDPIDILLVQEHHLSKRRIDSYGSILPGQWMLYWSPGIGNNGAQAGVCIAISERWTRNIIRYEELIPGRAQYIVLNLRNENIAFLNIYAPNSSLERSRSWNQLTELCLGNLNWCIGGDFNMIERVGDRTCGSLITVHGQELAY